MALQVVGGAVGNMICAHNVLVACAVVGNLGQEGVIIRRNLIPTMIYSIGAGVVGLSLIYVRAVQALEQTQLGELGAKTWRPRSLANRNAGDNGV